MTELFPAHAAQTPISAWGSSGAACRTCGAGVGGAVGVGSASVRGSAAGGAIVGRPYTATQGPPGSRRNQARRALR